MLTARKRLLPTLLALEGRSSGPPLHINGLSSPALGPNLCEASVGGREGRVKDDLCEASVGGREGRVKDDLCKASVGGRGGLKMTCVRPL